MSRTWLGPLPGAQPASCKRTTITGYWICEGTIKPWPSFRDTCYRAASQLKGAHFAPRRPPMRGGPFRGSAYAVLSCKSNAPIEPEGRRRRRVFLASWKAWTAAAYFGQVAMPDAIITTRSKRRCENFAYVRTRPTPKNGLRKRRRNADFRATSCCDNSQRTLAQSAPLRSQSGALARSRVHKRAQRIRRRDRERAGLALA